MAAGIYRFKKNEGRRRKFGKIFSEQFKIFCTLCCARSRDNVVGIATGYGLDGWGSEFEFR
jgi:hypothetical protein